MYCSHTALLCRKSSGPDPDPSPWLAVSHHIKEKNKAKPYDPKKSVWVPNKADGGYLEGLVLSCSVLACIDCLGLDR